jgi:hypothetical protein
MDDRPMRIQRRRVRGWRMPPNTISVTRPGRWGNPFLPWHEGGAAAAVELFRDWIAHPAHYPCKPSPPTLKQIQAGLKGKNLACYCKPGDPCHADVLLELANT